MIVYNVTIILDEDIHDEWLYWMKNEHVRDMMDTGCFISSQMLKVLDSPNEGVTYCCQYNAETLQKYNDYKSLHSARLQAAFPEKFANKFVAYRTIMEVVN